MPEVFVLINPPMRGVGLPLGVYSTLERAERAAVDFEAECRIQQLVLDAPADYAASETIASHPAVTGSIGDDGARPHASPEET